MADVLLKSELCRSACFAVCWALRQGKQLPDVVPLQKKYNEAQDALRHAVLSQMLFLPDPVIKAHEARVNRQGQNNKLDGAHFWTEQLAAESDGNREILKLAREALKPHHLPSPREPGRQWWHRRPKT
ncbi:hypothetical protein GGC47_002016 [Bosea sp. OAE752]